jgi:hypothetical protein
VPGSVREMGAIPPLVCICMARRDMCRLSAARPGHEPPCITGPRGCRGVSVRLGLVPAQHKPVFVLSQSLGH